MNSVCWTSHGCGCGSSQRSAAENERESSRVSDLEFLYATAEEKNRLDFMNAFPFNDQYKSYLNTLGRSNILEVCIH